MNVKRIVLSLGVIAIVGAVVWGGTGAFFSDTETSANNVFTAGSIDLKVDHTKQTYNGENCQTCSLELYSADENTQVVDGDHTVITDFPYAAPAVDPLTPIEQAYWYTSHPTADWIWASPATLVGDDGTNGDVTYTFERTFIWWGDAVNVDLLTAVAADNEYTIFLNGTQVAQGTGSAEYSELDAIEESAFLGEVVPGENTIKFVVTNKVNTPGNNTPLNNPGGLLYYINIHRDVEDCEENTEYNLACNLFTEKDLDSDEDFFFNFGDVKPGDWGTNVISLHVDTNDAFICAFPHGVEDLDNSSTEPELEDGDDDWMSDNNGELDNVLNFFVWEDDGDGEYNAGENVLVNDQPFSTFMAKMAIDAGSTDYLGLAWCAGDLTATPDADFTCDGSAVDNMSQTDSLSTYLTAYAVQARHNGDLESFSCEEEIGDPEDFTPEEEAPNNY